MKRADDIVERLREDAAGLRKAVSQASFASDTYVRVREPSLLIAVMDDAAEEIERLRGVLEEAAKVFDAWPTWDVWRSEAADTVRALKEQAHEPG